jgi:uncharacterized iron-regulated protein
MKRTIAVIASFLVLGGSSAAAEGSVAVPPQVIAVASAEDLDAIIPRLASARTVFIGEQHDRYDHHLNQLAVIRGMHARHPELAIGMEMFPQTDQPALDAYIARRIDETEMLRRTRFERRWRIGFRHYAAILRFARDQGIPVVALNAADELVAAVKAKGIAGLDAEERARLPAIDRTDAVYRKRLEEVYAQHPHAHRALENFVDVQLLWDESMAERAAGYLEANPARRMVVLAGNGHVAYGSGIPQRLRRRLESDEVIVVQGSEVGREPGVADYVLMSDPVPVPERP